MGPNIKARGQVLTKRNVEYRETNIDNKTNSKEARLGFLVRLTLGGK